jgi:putative sigma-54 modulation protein
MNLTISGHHLEVTPAIREYVQNKLERVLRHFDQVIDIAVILTVDNLTEKEKRQKAEINLRLAGKTVYRQVMKYKSKVQDHNHQAIKHMPEIPENIAAA